MVLVLRIVVGKFVGFTIMYCRDDMSIPKLSPCAKYVVSIVLYAYIYSISIYRLVLPANRNRGMFPTTLSF